MAKHKAVKVLAASVLPDLTEIDPDPGEDLKDAWAEVLQLPVPAHWRFNDYVACFAELGFPVDPAMMRHFASSARAAHEAASARAGVEPAPPRSARPPVGRHEPIVYYIRLGDLVKIGTTTDIGRRREQVPCQGIMAVEWAGRELEQRRHREFIASHHWGEWFRLDEPIGAHVVAVRATFEAAIRRTTESWLEEMRLP